MSIITILRRKWCHNSKHFADLHIHIMAEEQLA